jgi:hypothetical protein
VKQGGFRSPLAEVYVSASEQVCTGNCAGRAYARPEGLSPAARRYLVRTTRAICDWRLSLAECTK